MSTVRALLRIVAMCLATAALPLVDAACGIEVHSGYSGPYPSAAAQEALHGLSGRTLPPGEFGPDGVALDIESFGVVPNALTGKGPVVILRESGRAPTPHDPNAPQGAGGRWILPVLTDGDAADLVLRATGRLPANFGGATSAAYRAAVGLDEG